MRFISYLKILNTLSLPSGWQQKVDALKVKINNETDEKKRAKLIDDHSEYWKEIKPILAGLSNKKCWYTEAPQCGTDVDVDHYRPKKRVAEASSKSNPHPGYWWKAFELENYRYSCIYANRLRRDIESGIVGGKADSFPLYDESKRVFPPHTNCRNEVPLLLDPCKRTDTHLLTFKEDGEALPRFSSDKKPKEFKKADTSILLYNLNHSDFVKERLRLKDKIDDYIAEAREAFNYLDSGDASDERDYEKAINSLIEISDKDAPFSSFCKAYIETFKHEDFLDGFSF